MSQFVGEGGGGGNKIEMNYRGQRKKLNEWSSGMIRKEEIGAVSQRDRRWTADP